MDFLEGFYKKIQNVLKVCILMPYPEGVKLEALKFRATQTPELKWTGENDLTICWRWINELLGFLASKGCKGPQYDEVHLDSLIRSLGEPALTIAIWLRNTTLQT